MENKKTFKSYNSVTGVVNGTLAYDFAPQYGYVPQERETERVEKRRVRVPRRQIWVREEPVEQTETFELADTGFSRVSVAVASIGAIAAIVLILMVLMAQIQLLTISTQAASLENRITVLEDEHDKLTVQYETIFNLKDVEEYATSVLGMQEPREDQIYYISGVSSADRAVMITNTDTFSFDFGFGDMVESVQSYLNPQ